MVFIVIPVFNRIALTLKCLESVAAQTNKNYKVIVVDDGSTDGTEEKIKKAFPGVVVLKGDGNFYWTKSLNTGIESVQNEMKDDDFILHINNDTEFESSYIQNLLDFHARYPNSIVGSLSYDPESKQVSHLGVYHNAWTPFIKQNYREEEIDLERLSAIPYLKTVNISARGLLIPAYVIKKIGLFDDKNFPQYRSDEDYGIRCRKLGINVYICTNAIVQNSRMNTGWDHTIHKVTVKDFYRSFFSLLSTNNLAVRWKWAKKNSAIPPLYYVQDVAKLVAGFFKSIFYRRILGKRLNF